MKNISKPSDSSWEELFNECNDLRLPVSRKDSVETLLSHLHAVYDESGNKGQAVIDEELEEDPVYIGKYSRLKVIVNKILPF
jgi:hypothetical protein